MKRLKVFAAIIAVCWPMSAFSQVLPPQTCSVPDTVLSIMPAGDSIITGGPLWNLRYWLYRDLAPEFNVDFRGMRQGTFVDQNGNALVTLDKDFDPDHLGFPGAHVDGLQPTLETEVAYRKPLVVALTLGINDINRGQAISGPNGVMQELHNLFTSLFAIRTDSTGNPLPLYIVISEYAVHSQFPTAGLMSSANAQLHALAAQFVTEPHRVFVVPNPLDDSTIFPPPFDGIHPTDKGYEILGEEFAKAIRAEVIPRIGLQPRPSAVFLERPATNYTDVSQLPEGLNANATLIPGDFWNEGYRDIPCPFRTLKLRFAYLPDRNQTNDHYILTIVAGITPLASSIALPANNRARVLYGDAILGQAVYNPVDFSITGLLGSWSDGVHNPIFNLWIPPITGGSFYVQGIVTNQQTGAQVDVTPPVRIRVQ